MKAATENTSRNKLVHILLSTGMSEEHAVQMVVSAFEAPTVSEKVQRIVKLLKDSKIDADILWGLLGGILNGQENESNTKI